MLTSDQEKRVAAAEHLGGYGMCFRAGKGVSGQFYLDDQGSFEVATIEDVATGRVEVKFLEAQAA